MTEYNAELFNKSIIRTLAINKHTIRDTCVHDTCYQSIDKNKEPLQQDHPPSRQQLPSLLHDQEIDPCGQGLPLQ